MISVWRRRLEQFAQPMWIRASFFALVGVLAALLAVTLEGWLPEQVPITVGAAAVDHILNILASSMLAVTTFSLSIMAASYATAASSATPRATRLLMHDPTSQNVLSVFLGTFLFSLVGIIALSTGYYTDRGRFVLFLVTLGMVGVVVSAMLRWIDYLTHLGRVGETTRRVEKVAASAIDVRLRTPFLGGHRLAGERKEAMKLGQPIYHGDTGYVVYVDMGAMQSVAEDLGVEICLCALPGSFVHPERPVAVALIGPAPDSGTDKADDEMQSILKDLRNCFEVEAERSFSQDPRFGLSVLAEIASRALSPAINDPGTAIDVLGRGVRVLSPWVCASLEPEGRDVLCPRIFVPEITTQELFDDFFGPIARDGANVIEVQVRLLKALRALALMGDRECKVLAHTQAQRCLERSEGQLLGFEQEQLRTIVAEIGDLIE